MKKNILMLSLLCILSFLSCKTYKMNSGFCVYVYDDNNILISDECELKRIRLTFLGEGRDSYKRSVLTKSDENNQYYYYLSFEMSEVGGSQTDKYMNDFKASLKNLGIKLEDKKDRYKTQVLYPFRTKSNEPVIAGKISVKLEKK